jgi:hypothetical protein
MNNKKIISLVFVVAALYDGLLGAIFLVAGSSVFQWYGVPPPNHPGYIVFPAALLIIFALMFAAVARNPIANRNLIPYGILLKVSYCSAVLFYWLTEGLPDMWKPFCIIDFAFMFVFVWAWITLGKEKS